MTQYVVMNKKTGVINLAVKIDFHDGIVLDNMVPGGPCYSIILRSNKHDGWLMFAGDQNADGPWMFLNRHKKLVEDRIEVLCEL